MVQTLTMYSSFVAFISGISWWQGSNLCCHKVWFITMATAHNTYEP